MVTPFEKAVELIDNGNNIFITGGGGVGKSYLLNELKEHYGNELQLTSPTGVAAYNIGGQTINSWAGFGIDIEVNPNKAKTKRALKKQFETCKYLAIDEISMLNNFTFRSLDKAFKIIRNNDEPFGGLQMIFVGDFFQLPPVEGKDISLKYKGKIDYCFKTKAWKEANIITLYLKQVKRQTEKTYIDALNNIREGKQTKEIIDLFKARECNNEPSEGILRLFSKNEDIDIYNNGHLNKILNKQIFLSISADKIEKRNDADEWETLDLNDNKFQLNQKLHNHVKDFNKYEKLPKKLVLKETCRVMLLRNLDIQNGLVNGSCGTVISCDDETICVLFDNGIKKDIKKHENAHYYDWDESINGCRTRIKRKQFPLRLAYAITTHKSQGMTFDNVVLDFENLFAPGMAYVALSRTRKLEGLYLKNFNSNEILTSSAVIDFYNNLTNCIMFTENGEMIENYSNEYEDINIISNDTILETDFDDNTSDGINENLDDEILDGIQEEDNFQNTISKNDKTKTIDNNQAEYEKAEDIDESNAYSSHYDIRFGDLEPDYYSDYAYNDDDDFFFNTDSADLAPYKPIYENTMGRGLSEFDTDEYFEALTDNNEELYSYKYLTHNKKDNIIKLTPEIKEEETPLADNEAISDTNEEDISTETTEPEEIDYFNTAYNSTDNAEKESNYKIFIDKNPDSTNVPHAYNNLGVIYDEKEEYDEAIQYYTKAIDIYKTQNEDDIKEALTRSYNNRAKSYYFNAQNLRDEDYETAKKYYKNAVADWNKVLKRDSAYDIDYFRKAYAEDEIGRLTSALKDYTKYLNDTESAVGYNNRGWVYEQLGKFDKAKADYETSLKIEPNYELSINNLERLNDEIQEQEKINRQKIVDEYIKQVETEYYNENYAETLKICTEALSYDNENTDIHNYIALSHYANKNYQEAVNTWNNILNLDEEYEIDYFKKAYAENEMELIEEALNDYTIYLEDNPNDSAALNNRGLIWVKYENYKEAIRDYNKAIKSNNKSPRYFNNRAKAYYEWANSLPDEESDNTSKYYKKAVTDWKKVLKLDSDYGVNYLNLALSEINIEEYEDARKHYTIFIDNNSDADDLSIAYNNRGVAYERLEQLEAAQADYEKAHELAKDEELYINNLKNIKDLIKEKQQEIKNNEVFDFTQSEPGINSSPVEEMSNVNSTSADTILKEAEQLYSQKQYKNAINKCFELSDLKSLKTAQQELMLNSFYKYAKVLINRQEEHLVESLCNRLLARKFFSAKIYYLRGLIASNIYLNFENDDYYKKAHSDFKLALKTKDLNDSLKQEIKKQDKKIKFTKFKKMFSWF